MLGRIGDRTMKYFLLTVVFSLASLASAFSISSRQQFRLYSSVPSDVVGLDLSLDDIKADLVRACTRSSKPSLSEVRSMVGELEDKAEQVNTKISNRFFKHKRTTLFLTTSFGISLAWRRTSLILVWAFEWRMVNSLLPKRYCVHFFNASSDKTKFSRT